jgi:proteasome lid subunit RPN8/RPN11
MTTPVLRPAPSPEAEDVLLLPTLIGEAIVQHAVACYPLEACGLIAADAAGKLRMAYPLTNAEASPTRFTLDAREHFGAVCHAESHRWEIAGVFHSHPTGSAVLSTTDLTQPHPADWIHFVVGLRPAVQLRAWRLADGTARELRLHESE